jgi:hypothetical protein
MHTCSCEIPRFVALPPRQAGQALQELFELPCLHAASVNGSGRRWTAGLQKRFHTWREQRLFWACPDRNIFIRQLSARAEQA